MRIRKSNQISLLHRNIQSVPILSKTPGLLLLVRNSRVNSGDARITNLHAKSHPLNPLISSPFTHLLSPVVILPLLNPTPEGHFPFSNTATGLPEDVTEY